MHIGEEIRRQREERGLTGFQLAVKAGMAPSAVSQIENGKRTPSSASVVKLADALGVEVGDLYPKAQLRLPDPAEYLPEVLHVRMPPAAFEELREDADTLEAKGALREALTHEYRALVAAGEQLEEAGAPAEVLDEVRELQHVARKRWTVVTFDEAEAIIALDPQREPRPSRTEGLSVEEAYEQLQAEGVAQALAGVH